ncbi:ATP-binding protein [Actinomadura sp. 6N118]|uniref:ATP-binding protein n=1 Tax=Actinomadura sp. 6N118 TaxID=3375151 RepID=UPI00378CE182
MARSLLGIALTTLGLRGDTAGDAVLAASELATNAFNHGLGAGPGVQIGTLELWVWARATPAPQLVVSVFDTCRSSWPDTAPRDLLDEHGKGIGIVGMLAAAWGAHPTRSWLGGQDVRGKVVWCAFSLPGPWPNASTTAPPVIVARHLTSTLTGRGIANVSHRHGRGVSLVSVPVPAGEDINVWVEPGHLTYTSLNGVRIRRPVVDLYDVTETLVSGIDGHG